MSSYLKQCEVHLKDTQVNLIDYYLFSLVQLVEHLIV